MVHSRPTPPNAVVNAPPQGLARLRDTVTSGQPHCDARCSSVKTPRRLRCPCLWDGEDGEGRPAGTVEHAQLAAVAVRDPRGVAGGRKAKVAGTGERSHLTAGPSGKEHRYM